MKRPHAMVTAVVYLLAALSVAAGVPKILQLPQELGFLSTLGFSPIAVSALGVLQLAGGVLLFWQSKRLLGAAFTGIAFLVSSIAIFTGGNTQFGLISLLPLVALAVVIFFICRKAE